MSVDEAADRMAVALLPGMRIGGVDGQRRTFVAHQRYQQFARDVLMEAGQETLSAIVGTIETHSRITQGGSNA